MYKRSRVNSLQNWHGVDQRSSVDSLNNDGGSVYDWSGYGLDNDWRGVYNWSLDNDGGGMNDWSFDYHWGGMYDWGGVDSNNWSSFDNWYRVAYYCALVGNGHWSGYVTGSGGYTSQNGGKSDLKYSFVKFSKNFVVFYLRI